MNDTMWVTCEIWDENAREAFLGEKFQKGKLVRGVGNLIMSKWIDKNDGEEKKKNIIRINRLLNEEEFEKISNVFI